MKLVRDKLQGLLVLNETMPAVQPKAKMMPAYDLSVIDQASGPKMTYQDNIRECKEEERPLEVLPICRLIFQLVGPQPEFLHRRAFLVARKHFAHPF